MTSHLAPVGPVGVHHEDLGELDAEAALLRLSALLGRGFACGSVASAPQPAADTATSIQVAASVDVFITAPFLGQAAISLVVGAVAIIGLGAAELGRPPASPPEPSQQPTPPARTDDLSDEARLTRSVPVDTSWTEDCGRGGQAPCDAFQNGAAPVGLRADGTIVLTTSEVVIIKRSATVVSDHGLSQRRSRAAYAALHATVLVFAHPHRERHGDRLDRGPLRQSDLVQAVGGRGHQRPPRAGRAGPDTREGAHR